MSSYDQDYVKDNKKEDYRGRNHNRRRDDCDRDRERQSDRERGDEKERNRKKDKYCGELGHVVMNCPSVKAGKPPAKGSHFTTGREKDKKE